MMGTTGYSAPEQLHGGSADELADVYGLGAILYFLVAGQAPYRDEGFRATLVKQLTDPPAPIAPDPQWPHLKDVEAVIHKAMSVRPATATVRRPSCSWPHRGCGRARPSRTATRLRRAAAPRRGSSGLLPRRAVVVSRRPAGGLPPGRTLPPRWCWCCCWAVSCG